MLEKSPPFFRQKQASPQNRPSNKSPNFIIQNDRSEVDFFYFDKIAKAFQKISYTIILVFLALLIANAYLNLKLESKRIMMEPLVTQVDSFSMARAESLGVNQKIQFYKQTLSDRVTLGKKTKAVFSNIEDSTKVFSVRLTPSDFSLSIEVGNPFEFASLINRYLNDEAIGQITLSSADLAATTRKYKVVLNGVFR